MALTRKQARDQIHKKQLLTGTALTTYEALYQRRTPITANALSVQLQINSEVVAGHPCWHKRLENLETLGLAEREEHPEPAERRHGKLWSLVPCRLPGPVPTAKRIPMPTPGQLKVACAVIEDLTRGHKPGSYGGAIAATKTWLRDLVRRGAKATPRK